MTIARTAASPEEARALWTAVIADNPEFVEGGVEGSTLSIQVRAPSARSLRATLDDLLAALAAAERSAATARRR